MLEDLPRKTRDLFLDALVSYSDGCTLPQLTPTCPFFRRAGDGPTCDEECRSIAERYGVTSRPVRTAVVEGGLVLKGRQVPTSAAGGLPDFDAQRIYITERNRPPHEQSTTTLLVGLVVALRPQAYESSTPDENRVLAIWQELESRSVPVEQVVRGAVLPQVAVRIAERALLPHIAQSRALPASASVELQRQLADAPPGSWTTALDALVAAWTREPQRFADIQGQSPYRHLAPGRTVKPFARPDDTESYVVEADAHVMLAFSPEFIGRVEEWLCRLLEEDMLAALRADPPHPSVFLALDHSRHIRDETGLWIWERLSVTRFEEWSDSSLLLEWRYLRGEYRGTCPDRVFAERVISHEMLATRALDQLSRERGRRLASHDLDPSHFVRQAAQHLEMGRWEEAASIFRGLSEIRPADGDAWNNLGFCELHGDPARAFVTLEHASLFELDHPLLNVANRCLALHLLGRDDEAVALAESTSYMRDGSLGSVYLWQHTTRAEPLKLRDHANASAYLEELLVHISAGACT